ncbi:hypothetical protein F5Y05DRAFT_395005 [Hypoxylon sp. FL0543]|nr:hypothetical protein F5Y05DRAFT_395005 [Hypoxylon sp. FL0543]
MSPAEDHLLAVQRAGTTENKPSSTPKKLMMATAFAVTTPIGMAIGISTLEQFNSNDPSILIAFGILNSGSAIVLLSGVVPTGPETARQRVPCPYVRRAPPLS